LISSKKNLKIGNWKLKFKKVLDIDPQSPEAKSLRDSKIIIWDEATMANKFCFETVYRLLRDLMKTVDPNLAYIPFGGKKFLAGGDFWQEAFFGKLCPLLFRALAMISFFLH